MAIWFPLGESDLRVVRLAYRESALLNSRWALRAVARACAAVRLYAAQCRAVLLGQLSQCVGW